MTLKLFLKDHTFDLSKRPLLMGILNVTPDSFSDGGQFVTEETIEKHTEGMIGAGVDIIDVGGESTRPFSVPVPLDEELKRVIPVIERIRRCHQILISIDTTKAEVARQALAAGADIVNDISALLFDPLMVEVVRLHDAPVIIMHMQGTPVDMQIRPAYLDVVDETIEFFRQRIDWLEGQGISRQKIIIDPGIGFGKTVDHNLSIIKRLSEYSVLDCPVLVGHSRKSFIGKILDCDGASRDLATAALTALLVEKGVSIIRVHNVEKNKQAMMMALAVKWAGQVLNN